MGVRFFMFKDMYYSYKVMEINIFQVDAFAEKPFEGNSAAVCPLSSWLPDEQLQHIAFENNLSETAFFVGKNANEYDIRWFTPESEVDLCGHATLASAHVLFEHFQYENEEIIFQSQSGALKVSKFKDFILMDFPSRMPVLNNYPVELIDAIGAEPKEVLKNRDFVLVFDSEEVVKSIAPNFEQLKHIQETLGFIVTAPSDSYDFVCRFFAPAVGINEDPVTGSAFSELIPYWSGKLKKNILQAYQCSKRGGKVYGENHGERVTIGGHAITYLEGVITL